MERKEGGGMSRPLPRMPRAPIRHLQRKKTGGNGGIAAFAALVGTAFFSIPFVAHYLKGENFNSSEKPLNATQIRRGAYQNTGSRDVGVDKDWDFASYTWNGRRGADAHQEKLQKAARSKE